MKRRRIDCAPALAAVLVFALAVSGWAEGTDGEKGGDRDRPGAPKVSVRPSYVPGRKLQYNLKLSGATAWTPKPKGMHWGKMVTDFTFVLATKTIRESGACTFALLGEKLKSVANGPKGAVEVVADRKKARYKVEGKGQIETDETPLAKAMTVTFGPLGAVRFHTGIVHVAPYLLPHVDRRFWALLTLAPVSDVAPGDKWEDSFDLPVPGGVGRPLKLTGKWQALGWQTYRRQKVFATALTAELKLDDSELILKNGDRVHVTSGTYEAVGKVLWNVDRGLLCFATATQKILIKADKPTPRALRSEHKCTLQLLRAADGG